MAPSSTSPCHLRISTPVGVFVGKTERLPFTEGQSKVSLTTTIPVRYLFFLGIRAELEIHCPLVLGTSNSRLCWLGFDRGEADCVIRVMERE
eukprot:1393079-Amorphochlora_amoeboformis.AAC.2